MKEKLRKKNMKWLVLSIQTLAVILFCVSVFWIRGAMMTTPDFDDLKSGSHPYEETKGCGISVANVIAENSVYARNRHLFETDGKFDKNKVIDILHPSVTDKKKQNRDTSFTVATLQNMQKLGIDDWDFYSNPQSCKLLTYSGNEISLTDVFDSCLPVSKKSLTKQYQEASSVYSYQLSESLYDILDRLSGYLNERNINLQSNVKFYVRNTKNGNVYTNIKGMENTKAVPLSQELFSEWMPLLSARRIDGQISFENLGDNPARMYLQRKYGNAPILGNNEEILIAVDANFREADTLADQRDLYRRYVPLFPFMVAAFITSLIIYLICLVLVAIQTDGKSWSDKIPVELMMIAVFFAIGLAIAFLLAWDLTIDSGYQIALCTAGTTLCSAFCMWVYLSMVRRIKAKTFWQSTLLSKLCSLVMLVYSTRTLVWKRVLAFAGLVLAHYILLGAFGGLGIFFCLIGDGVLLYFLIKEAEERQVVKEGLIHLSNGDLSEKIVTDSLKGENRIMAEYINAAGDGLQSAVEKAMKNERMKTELITNVSHDIKTPLTSIINYVDLLKREDLGNKTAKDYLEILDAKSQRLKQLTLDLVEASKASSGNIDLTMNHLQLEQLLMQAIGEFDEKLKHRHLTLVTNLPEENITILADGRHLWRVFENLLGNISKYAMPNTRVYIDLKLEGEQAVLSFKNISESPLNVSADELTERFTRGDESRSTEGSGLGLSIAKDLTRLQGGSLAIYLDGDLFKVTLKFPLQPA